MAEKVLNILVAQWLTVRLGRLSASRAPIGWLSSLPRSDWSVGSSPICPAVRGVTISTELYQVALIFNIKHITGSRLVNKLISARGVGIINIIFTMSQICVRYFVSLI